MKINVFVLILSVITLTKNGMAVAQTEISSTTTGIQVDPTNKTHSINNNKITENVKRETLTMLPNSRRTRQTSYNLQNYRGLPSYYNNQQTPINKPYLQSKVVRKYPPAVAQQFSLTNLMKYANYPINNQYYGQVSHRRQFQNVRTTTKKPATRRVTKKKFRPNPVFV